MASRHISSSSSEFSRCSSLRNLIIPGTAPSEMMRNRASSCSPMFPGRITRRLSAALGCAVEAHAQAASTRKAAPPRSASPRPTEGEDRCRAHIVFLVLQAFQQRGHRPVLEHLGPGPPSGGQHAGLCARTRIASPGASQCLLTCWSASGRAGPCSRTPAAAPPATWTGTFE
jgi:hypothetical protein